MQLNCHALECFDMATPHMTPELFALVADRFKAFAEPTRLHILYELRQGERTVTEIGEATGIGQANLSRHLQQLHATGLVSRRKEGLFTFYDLADRDVLKLCDLMCGRLQRETTARKRALSRS
jgi:DNA-binding transcriptional ArsR family regulator